MRQLGRVLILGALMLSATACEACFVSGTVLPAERDTVAAVNNGQAGRDLMAAVFAGDRARVEQTLGADPRLAATTTGQTDLLRAAIGRCDMEMVDTLLRLGAPPDGPGGETPLHLAIRAVEPWFAERLLKAGANPDPQKLGRPYVLDEAIALGKPGRVRLLLAYGADLHWADALGHTPLQNAVAMDKFVIAELLLDQGANPWATDQAGGTIGPGLVQPLLFEEPEERAAQQRLLPRIQALSWPWPPPAARAVRRLALAGHWPPEAARKAGAPPVPPAVLAQMRALYDDEGAPRPPPEAAR